MTAVAVPEVPLGGTITHLTQCSNCGHYWLGRVELFGAMFHVDLIRVVEDADGDQDVPKDAGKVVHEIWDDMQEFYPAAYYTVAVPGLDGRFVMFVYPFDQ
jgi:hypothetical protein